MMYTRFTLALAALALAACDSDAPKETVVHGTVLDAQTGQPLQGIPYDLYTALSGPGSYQSFDKGVTDSKGEFTARTMFGCCINLGLNGGNGANSKYWGTLQGVKQGRAIAVTFRLEPKNL